MQLLQMPAKQGLLAAAVHWAWALWLAFNIIFNYLLAVLASPGFTSELSMEVCEGPSHSRAGGPPS